MANSFSMHGTFLTWANWSIKRILERARLTLKMLWSDIRPRLWSKSPSSCFIFYFVLVWIILSRRCLKQLFLFKVKIHALSFRAYSPCWFFFHKFDFGVTSSGIWSWAWFEGLFFYVRSISQTCWHCFLVAFKTYPFLSFIRARSRYFHCFSHSVTSATSKAIIRRFLYYRIKYLRISSWSRFCKILFFVTFKSCSVTSSDFGFGTTIMKLWLILSWACSIRVLFLEFKVFKFCSHWVT